MRRTNKIIGMVNFPVDSNQYESTGEGGMFVELWVVEKKIFECGACCGYSNITSTYTASLIGTDQKANHDNFSKLGEDEFAEFLRCGGEQRFFLEEELFPFIQNEEQNQEKYQSFPLLACITMGSTGWSGFGGGDPQNEDYWRCQYEDLNDNGKLIYDTMKKEYPKSALLLVTWLDT